VPVIDVSLPYTWLQQTHIDQGFPAAAGGPGWARGRAAPGSARVADQCRAEGAGRRGLGAAGAGWRTRARRGCLEPGADPGRV